MDHPRPNLIMNLSVGSYLRVSPCECLSYSFRCLVLIKIGEKPGSTTGHRILARRNWYFCSFKQFPGVAWVFIHYPNDIIELLSPPCNPLMSGLTSNFGLEIIAVPKQ